LKSHLANLPFQNLKRRSALASMRRALSVVPIDSDTAPAKTDPVKTHANTSVVGSNPKKDAKLAARPPPATAATRNAIFSADDGSTPWL